MNSRHEMARLEAATAAWLQYRAAGGGPVAEFLAQHEHLRDLLEPMLAGTEPPAAAAAGGPAAAAAAPGRTLGDFQLLREIGRGGMGVVYEARQVSLDRRVAVKVLPERLTAQPASIARFKREAGMAARLAHEGIVEVYAVGTTDELHWFAMERIDGVGLDVVIAGCRSVPVETLDADTVRRTLERHVAGAARAAGDPPLETRSPPARSPADPRVRGWVGSVVGIVASVADALEHAHGAGVIHRDVKPSNILLRADGRPVLTDFGLAREQGLPSISLSGEFAGTPYYVAPEQARLHREGVDHRADVFALGVTLYELLTLTRPFEGETTQAVLHRILTREPPDPRRLNKGLPEDLVAVLMKALEKEPQRRYQTAAAMAADLRAVLALRPVTARRWTRALRLRQWLRREPLKAAFVAALAAGIPALSFLGGYVLVKQEQIAAGEAGLRAAAFEASVTEGFLRLADDRYAEATAALTQALALMPDSVEAVAGLALADVNVAGRPAGLRRLDAHAGVVAASPFLQRLRAMWQATADAVLPPGPRPRTALEWFVAGMIEYERRRLDQDPLPATRRALACFDNAVVFAPHARALYLFLRSNCAATVRDDAKALQSADAILALWPDAPNMWGDIGYALQYADVPRAIAAFRKAIEHEPGRAMHHANLGVVLKKTGEVAAAAQAFERALELDPKLAGAHMRYGELLYETGRYDEAIVHFQRTAELGNDPIEYARWAEACLRQSRLAEGIAIFERALAAHAGSAALRHGYGNALMQAGRLDEAVVELQRSCELDPGSVAAWYTLGSAKQRQQDPTCLEAFARAIALDASFHPAHYSSGRELMQQNRHAEAIAPLQQAIALAPDYARAHSALGLALVWAGRGSEAAAPLRKAEQLEPPYAARHRRILGELARDAAHRDAVVACCHADLQQDPDARAAHELLLAALTAAGDRAGRGAALRRWADAHHDDAAAWRALAADLVDPELAPELRDPAAAVAAARRASELAGGDAQAALLLADALFQGGDADGALRALETAAAAAAPDLAAAIAERRLRFTAR